MSEAARKFKPDTSLESFLHNQDRTAAMEQPKRRNGRARLAVVALEWTRDVQPNCQGQDPRLFFPNPSDRQTLAEAKQICEDCPVRQQCLQHALDNDEHGVWGGTSKEERARIKRKRPQSNSNSQ